MTILRRRPPLERFPVLRMERTIRDRSANPGLGRDQEIYLVDRCDNFASGQEFFQIIAMAQSLVVENTFPKVRNVSAGFEYFGEVCRWSHPAFLSNSGASPVAGFTDVYRWKSHPRPVNRQIPLNQLV